MKISILKLYLPYFPFFSNIAEITITSWKFKPRFIVIRNILIVIITIANISPRTSINICFICNKEVHSTWISKHWAISRIISQCIRFWLKRKLIIVTQSKNKRLSRFVFNISLTVILFPRNWCKPTYNLSIISLTNNNCICNIFAVIEKFLYLKLVLWCSIK